MSEKTEVIVWIPLPAKAKWKGEGINRTIENIFRHLPAHIICHVVVSSWQASDLMKLAKDYPHVRVCPMGRRKKINLHTVQSDADLPHSFWEWISNKIKLGSLIKYKGNPLWSYIKYFFDLYFYSLLQRFNLFVPDKSVIWLPLPHLNGLSLLKGKKIYSFWDPFVFEYREFSDGNQVVFKKLFSSYRQANAIITQSQANKDFLINLFQVEAQKIEVIPNGSPEYSHLLDSLTAIGRRNKEGLLAKWMKPQHTDSSQKEAVNTITESMINKAILWRLLYKLNKPTDKVLMVSTQVRPYKGFDLLIQILNELVKQETTYRYQFIFTTNIPDKMKERYPLLYERLHEIIRVSDEQHALLYYVSDLVIHPSHVEGGLGVYPQFEAASLGTPTLVNIGRHVLEQDNSKLSHHAENFTDIDKLLVRIHDLVSSEQSRQLNLEETRELIIPWQSSAKKYGDVFEKMTAH